MAGLSTRLASLGWQGDPDNAWMLLFRLILVHTAGPLLHAAQRLGVPACAALLLGACSPALDWRDVRSGQGQLFSLFPCKPTVEARDSAGAGGLSAASLQVCQAQDMTFAILSVSAPPATQGAPLPSSSHVMVQALDALAGGAAARWGEPTSDWNDPMQPAVAAALQARCRRWNRPLGDGSALHTQACFLSHQGHLFQVSVSGARLDPAAVEAFFASLRLAS